MVRIIGSCLRISEDTEIRLIHLLSIFVRVIPNLFTALQISSFKVFFQISETLHQRTVFRFSRSYQHNKQYYLPIIIWLTNLLILGKFSFLVLVAKNAKSFSQKKYRCFFLLNPANLLLNDTMQCIEINCSSTQTRLLSHIQTSYDYQSIIKE